MLKKFFSLFRSLKLTAVLIAYFIIAAAISTFIPRSRFFNTPAFLVPVGLFFINLLSCTIFRFTGELKKRSPNFGPDILHGGLLLFIIAAFLSALNRVDGSITLSRGQSAMLPNGTIIVLDDLEYIEDKNARPLAWKSYLSVFQDNVMELKSYPLEVNHPLKIGGFSLYQYSYGIYADGLNAGDEYTVLRAVWDPGYVMVVISLLIVGTGIVITLLIKLRRQKL
ncbi:cytochrome c biogenesis protein ResB [Treponema primitia]|uniref:cytochrome c biogenesis protein ResB n=1 Tax=Treponema primitia TaxID=88058 RepID=UPI000570F370|nr:cytochrome c biogenesis protein ResB [Treponema primitia]